MIEIHRFKTGNELAGAVVDLLRQTLPTPGSLMLSGGSTPRAAYNRLAAAPCPVHPKRRIFLSDERLVPPDSPNSNQGNLQPLLKVLGCGDRFIPIDTGRTVSAAAAAFAAAVGGLEDIDLGLLGMGADGHTAGIFTIGQARDRSALALHALRPDGMQGVSVAPALLHRIGRLVLLVAGESKRAAIDTLLRAPGTIPAGIVLSGHPNVELWTYLAV